MFYECHNSQRDDAGFTLLEVTVALAILLLALGALYPIFGKGPGRIDYSREISVGIAIARAHLEEEVALEDWANLPKSGAQGDWQWQVSTTRLAHSSDSDTSPGALYRVVVTATHTRGKYGAPIEFVRIVWRKND